MTRLDGRVMRLERDRRRSAPGPCPACGLDPDAPFALSWPDADADPTPADDPRLTLASLRPIPMRPNTSQMKPTTGRSLPASASGISMRWASTPLSAKWFRIASAVCASTGWCRMATLCLPPSSSPSSPSSAA